ncbi:MAG: hypothetical protein FJY95_16485 [Candidatus Handelsmanbacteria bacterium]|nr:hypothetical protein [Candidatus Handelsmanbacteria bacterium]
MEILGQDIRGVAVVFILLFLPLVFYVLLNFLAIIEKILSFLEKILISIFGEFLGRIFRVTFGILGAIIGVLKAIVDVFRPKRARPRR